MLKPKPFRVAARHVLTLAAASAIAIALCTTVAEPAQASSAKCQEYLRAQHYQVGPKVRAACNTGQTGGSSGTLACYIALLAIDVSADHAAVACNAAND